jgi:hypothetical protein
MLFDRLPRGRDTLPQIMVLGWQVDRPTMGMLKMERSPVIRLSPYEPWSEVKFSSPPKDVNYFRYELIFRSLARACSANRLAPGFAFDNS